MRSISILAALVLCWGARAGGARAEVPARADALPPALSAYTNPEAATRMAALEGHAYYFQADPATLEATEKQNYWPVFYSALVPGLGELTMGYTVRGIALMAVEVAAWTGYFVNHDDGMEKRDAYEAFADQWWEQQKFIDDHPLVYPLTGQDQDYLEAQGRAVSGSGGEWWTGYVPWVSKAEDKQHYYENIGKYDWFVSGWSDFDPTINPPLAESAKRDEYVNMRNDSNNSLDDANAFVWVSLAARVFSIAETAIIVRNRRADDAQASRRGPEVPIAIKARPRGYNGGELALEVRFK